MDVSSIKCELRVIEAKNIQTKPNYALFIRCYISAGNNRKIQVNTREIMSTKIDDDYVFWDDTFSLECNGAQNSINNLKEENIMFELRWRNMNPNFLGKTSGSQVLARAEIPWKSAFDAPNMEILTRVSMTSNEIVESEECCMKPPALQVGIKVEISDLSRKMSSEEMKRNRRQERLKNKDDCGCTTSSNQGCCSCVDNELFFVAQALDLF